jgi:peptide chain release factor 2
MHGGYFDLDQTEKEVAKLEAQINAPDFWSDQEEAKKVSSRYHGIKEELEEWKKLKQETAELLELAVIFNGNSEEEAEHLEELQTKFKELETSYNKKEFAILFSDAKDKGEAIISLHAGTGGVDAMDWTAMLLRMYLRFCERHNLEAKILDETAGQEAGVKSVTLEVSGRYAYGWLKSEAGVHRLVRISPFDAEKMRHTSFALVEVLPEMPEVDTSKINEEDLKIEVFRAGGHGGQSVNTTDSAVRITHVPTGIMVKCQNERSQLQNRNTAMKILTARLAQFYAEQAEENIQKIKGEHRQVQWGNQARSYVLQPYRLVKDHRTGYETQDTDRILNGELDDFVESYLRFKIQK